MTECKDVQALIRAHTSRGLISPTYPIVSLLVKWKVIHL